MSKDYQVLPETTEAFVKDYQVLPETTEAFVKDYQVLPETTEAFAYVAMIRLIIKQLA